MLEQAAQSLREHVDQRWVQISDRVLTRALRATRTSLAVQAKAPSGVVHISEQVLITHLRDAISTVPHVKIQDVVITTEGLDTYAGLTITINARDLAHTAYAVSFESNLNDQVDGAPPPSAPQIGCRRSGRRAEAGCTSW